MKEHINLKIESVEKQITLLTNVVYGLIALIVAAIGIPQIINHGVAERKGSRTGKNKSRTPTGN